MSDLLKTTEQPESNPPPPIAGLPSIIPPPPAEIMATVEHEPSIPEPEPILFELKLTETGVQIGSIPVTWCVDREWLLNNSHKEIYILLGSVSPMRYGWHAEWRGWSRLSDMMAYVTFYRGGKNRIVGIATESKYRLEQWMQRTDDKSNWVRNSIQWPNDWDTPPKDAFEICSTWTSTEYYFKNLVNYIDVDLPTECFAKEPSDWEKNWVNYFFRAKAVDQCEFRRRRILAYTVQPIALALLAILYCFVVTCVHLFNLMIGKWTVWNGLGDIEIIERKDFLKVKKFGPLWWIFLPLPWLTVVSVLLFKFTKPHILWLLLPPTYLLIITMGLVVMFLFTLVIAWIGSKLPILEAARKKAAVENQKRLDALHKAELEALELLLCSSGKRIRRIRDLPSSKRTIKLRFNGLKASVCKPFAR